MTTTAATLIEQTARPAALDRAVARMTSDEPTLSDIATVLHIVGTADDVDGVRIQALAYLAARALGSFDAWTRTAPPAALKDIVAETLTRCAAPWCENDVAPWEDDNYHGCCGPTCQADLFASSEGRE